MIRGCLSIQSRKELLNEISVLNGAGKWVEGECLPFLPFLFYVIFSFSLLSGILEYTPIVCPNRGAWERYTWQSRLRKSRCAHTFSNLCRIIRPWWLELEYVQSTLETAKNNQCYPLDTTACETRKADVFILQEVTDVIKATLLEKNRGSTEPSPPTLGLWRCLHATRLQYTTRLFKHPWQPLAPDLLYPREAGPWVGTTHVSQLSASLWFHRDVIRFWDSCFSDVK